MPQDKPKSVLKAVSSAVDSSRETPNSLIRRPQKVGVKMYVVSAAICKSFDWLGRAVARRPYSFIMTTLLFTVGCGVAFQMLFEQELDGEDLYTPASAQSFKDRDYVMETFGSPGQLVRILVTRDVNLDSESDCAKRNLLKSASDANTILGEYMDLYDLIMSQSAIVDEKAYKFADVCHKPDITGSECEVLSILGIWNYSRSSMEADDDLLGSMKQAVEKESLISYLGVPVPSRLVVGKNQDQGPCFGTVEVLQMVLFLENEKVTMNGLSRDRESGEWSQKLIETIDKDWKTNNLIGYTFSIDAIDIESEKYINKDVEKLVIGYVLIFVFSHMVLFKNSPVFFKAHLATGSIISVVMAIVTAFGLAQIVGIKFNLVVQTLPFILMGLGMDDTFVIMGAFHSTDIHLSVEDRMAATLIRAGSSIFVTSVTDAVAFAVGAFTELPALRDFTLYASLGIAFDFVYQVTFFAALVVLDARREQRARLGAPGWGFQCGCGKTEFDTLPSEQTSTELRDQVEKGKDKPRVTHTRNWKRKIVGTGDFDPEKPSISTRIAGNWLPKFTLHPIGSAAVVVIEALLLAAAVYGCAKVKMDFRYRDWFVPNESYLKAAINVDDRYFYGDQVQIAVFTKEPTDGADLFSHLTEYENMISTLGQDKYVSDVPPVTTWYDAYSTWLSLESPFANQLDMYGRAPNATAFTQSVRLFLEQPAGVYFKDSVDFGEKGITATQVTCYSKRIVDGTFAVAMVDSIRESVEEAAPMLAPGAYSEFFLFYDGFKLITQETVRNVIMAGVAVFIITTIILADMVASIIVTLMIGLTDTMLFGFLWYAGLSFNTVTAINMVLAVGIAVDYSAHIAHSFLVLKGSRRERAQGALLHIGGEVIAGAFTTWLAVAVMGLAEHYIFKAFFKMFFAIVVTGAWHGLVVLPIVLSIIGPQPYAGQAN